MAHLSNPPGFGNNSWAENTWAAAMAAQLPRFRVADANAWKPSVVTGLDRTVQLAIGAAWGCGVWDRTSAAENIQFAANGGSTDRFDVLVARWSWTLRTVVFATIQGGALPPAAVTTTVDSTKINRIPGVQYDGVIAVLRVRPGVGAFASTDLYDIRAYGGGSGALCCTQGRFVNVIDGSAGQELWVSSTDVTFRHNGTDWINGSSRPLGLLCRPVQISNASGGIARPAAPAQAEGDPIVFYEMGRTPDLYIPANRSIELLADVQWANGGALAALGVRWNRVHLSGGTNNFQSGEGVVRIGGANVADRDLRVVHHFTDQITVAGTYVWVLEAKTDVPLTNTAQIPAGSFSWLQASDVGAIPLA